MGFGSLFGAIGLATLKAEIRAAGRRFAIAAVSVVLLLIAICFAVAAFTVWLAGEIGTVPALLAVAGGFLLLALIVQGVARLTSGRRSYGRAPRPPPAPPRPPPLTDVPPPVGGTVPAGSELGVVATVAVLGFLLARQMLKR